MTEFEKKQQQKVVQYLNEAHATEHALVRVLQSQIAMLDFQASRYLMEGEVAIQPEGSEQPFIYRGFQMVDEEKFRDLRGGELRKLNQNGALPLIMAHLFSLSVIREIFARQVKQGTGPVAVPQPATAEA